MGFVDAVKNFVGFETEEFEDEAEEQDIVEERENSALPFSKKSKVVPLHQNVQTKIVILKPRSFEESKNVADEIKLRKPVVFDVGALEPEEARRVVDFVAGAVYGVDGNIQRVSGGIFVAAPSHIDIMGEFKGSFSKGNIDWGMF
ncbi:MAG: cell division protein SepF [Clostridia bacterium]|nr:cell division protein SepF [Clostridia bacterium]